jgi:hypothetical protein
MRLYSVVSGRLDDVKNQLACLSILPASGHQYAQGNGPDAQVFLLTLNFFP